MAASDFALTPALSGEYIGLQSWPRRAGEGALVAARGRAVFLRPLRGCCLNCKRGDAEDRRVFIHIALRLSLCLSVSTRRERADYPLDSNSFEIGNTETRRRGRRGDKETAAAGLPRRTKMAPASSRPTRAKSPSLFVDTPLLPGAYGGEVPLWQQQRTPLITQTTLPTICTQSPPIIFDPGLLRLPVSLSPRLLPYRATSKQGPDAGSHATELAISTAAETVKSLTVPAHSSYALTVDEPASE